MWPNPVYCGFTANLVTFTKEILNGKHHFLSSVKWKKYKIVLFTFNALLIDLVKIMYLIFEEEFYSKIYLAFSSK